MYFILKLYCIVLAILVPISFAFLGEQDEVLILPGLIHQPTFKHYSGNLNGSNTLKLHYWFITSEANFTKDLLVIWLNGAPGCSFINGLLTEHGPFRVTEREYLEYNPHSWNKIANIIYLESPVCVGFSFSRDGKCNASDDSTSLLNHNALKDFFVKFPQYEDRDFYIAGQGYGRFYVSTLAEKIVLSKEIPYIKLKGIAVGNGASSVKLNVKGVAYFANNHGLLSDGVWENIITFCETYLIIIIVTLILPTVRVSTRIMNEFPILFKVEESSSLIIPCMNIKIAANYLNKPLVRYALHIPKKVPQWEIRSVKSMMNYVQNYVHMTRQYNTLFKKQNLKIWIYNGDLDLTFTYLSDEWFFESFNRSIDKEKYPWLYIDENKMSQVGGFVKIWDKFSWITVLGAVMTYRQTNLFLSSNYFNPLLMGKIYKEN